MSNGAAGGLMAPPAPQARNDVPPPRSTYRAPENRAGDKADTLACRAFP